MTTEANHMTLSLQAMRRYSEWHFLYKSVCSVYAMRYAQYKNASKITLHIIFSVQIK